MTPQWNIERICAKAQMPCEAFAGEFIVDTESYMHKGLHHAFNVWVEKGYILRARIYLPGAEKTVPRLEKLCEMMQCGFQAKLKNIVEVGFDTEANRFFITMGNIPLTDLEAKISNFVEVCDIAFPLLNDISTSGEWDENLVHLGFYSRFE